MLLKVHVEQLYGPARTCCMLLHLKPSTERQTRRRKRNFVDWFRDFPTHQQLEAYTHTRTHARTYVC